ncbi:MAG: DUF1045 domain-containing protein [Pseudomonadota bacterium]
MDEFARYAIFAVPDGAFFRTASTWLGWDSAAGIEVAHPDLPNLPASEAAILTATPRKYGFHGTLKPPFRLARGTTRGELEAAIAAFCAARPGVEIPRLAIRAMGGFVAAVPATPQPDLSALAAAIVAGFDPFRAAAPPDELTRRRKAGLSENQELMLRHWGYPYVFDEFRFHLTLTGKIDGTAAEETASRLSEHFAPVLPAPYAIDNLCMLGEASDGRFHILNRYPLTG